MFIISDPKAKGIRGPIGKLGAPGDVIYDELLHINENRNLSKEQMLDIECSAEWRNYVRRRTNGRSFRSNYRKS